MMLAQGKRASATQKAGILRTRLLEFACAFEPLDALVSEEGLLGPNGQDTAAVVKHGDAQRAFCAPDRQIPRDGRGLCCSLHPRPPSASVRMRRLAELSLSGAMRESPS